MRVESFHPRQVSDVRMRPVVGRIRYGHYSFIFLRIPSSAKSLAYGDRQKIFTELGEWMFLAINASTPAVMFGMRNRKWMEPGLHELSRDKRLHQSNFRLCSFGLKVDNSNPSPSVVEYHSKSTMFIQPRPCRCKSASGSAVEHLADKKTDSTDRKRLNEHYDRVETQVLTHLFSYSVSKDLPRSALMSADTLGTCAAESAPASCSGVDARVDLSSTSDSRLSVKPHTVQPDSNGISSNGLKQDMQSPPHIEANSYPTEQAERAKLRKKEGHVVQKRNKHVEMHYDDIGEDLTGLDKNIVLYQRDVYQEAASYEVTPDFAFSVSYTHLTLPTKA